MEKFLEKDEKILWEYTIEDNLLEYFLNFLKAGLILTLSLLFYLLFLNFVVFLLKKKVDPFANFTNIITFIISGSIIMFPFFVVYLNNRLKYNLSYTEQKNYMIIYTITNKRWIQKNRDISYIHSEAFTDEGFIRENDIVSISLDKVKVIDVAKIFTSKWRILVYLEYDTIAPYLSEFGVLLPDDRIKEVRKIIAEIMPFEYEMRESWYIYSKNDINDLIIEFNAKNPKKEMNKWKIEIYEDLTKQYELIITEDKILKIAREKGWKGSGIESDPIIIKSIDEDFKKDFVIMNNKYHLIFENCEFPSKIILNHCKNIKFINCSILSLRVQESFNNYLKDNKIKEFNIDYYSRGNIFENNKLSEKVRAKLNEFKEDFNASQEKLYRIITGISILMVSFYFPLLCIYFFLISPGGIDNLIELICFIFFVCIIIMVPLIAFILWSKRNKYKPNIIIENEPKLKIKNEVNQK